MQTFEINEDLLSALDEYHVKSSKMELYHNIGNKFDGNLELEIDDDLIYNVPIYDTARRRFASFCSFTEAVWYKDSDPRGNGVFFKNCNVDSELDWLLLFYLFRLCGSGINYNPRVKKEKLEDVLGTHGFGNFWIINSMLEGKSNREQWIKDLVGLNQSFTNNKGYLLPQFKFEGIDSGHLKKFIVEYSFGLVEHIYNELLKGEKEIYQVADIGNNYLNKIGFKKQNFVLTAFAADLSEYFSKYVNPKSRVYAGTNATKCIKAIFPKKDRSTNDFDYINNVLGFLANRYNLNPIDCEDSRACDPVRYFTEYQSEYHLLSNSNVVYKNNSILKKKWGHEKYYQFSTNLK